MVLCYACISTKYEECPLENQSFPEEEITFGH